MIAVFVNTSSASAETSVTETATVQTAPKEHVIAEGDYLDKIATQHGTTWQKVWGKNPYIVDPNVIYAGNKVVIPAPDEVVPDRTAPVVATAPPEPQPVSQPAVAPAPVCDEATQWVRADNGQCLDKPVEARQTAPVAQHTAPAPKPVQQAPASYGGGNTYDWGYCTWYVKERRGASLPNGLGNANTWYSRAQQMGMATGSAPRAGAVGTTTRGSLGHVVYVESVNADGSINISEMNYQGFGVKSYRTTSASEFLYIY